MVIVVREVCKVGPPCADAPGRSERFIQAHVRGMRVAPELIENGNLHLAHFFQGGGRHLPCNRSSKPDRLIPFWMNRKPVVVKRPVWQLHRDNFEVADIGNGPIDQMRFRDEISPRPRTIVIGVQKHTPEWRSWFLQSHRPGDALPPYEIAKPAVIIHLHDVVGVRVR